jgi:HD-GYP domain-containing protein (c-di-GMP phosphodiesterase class II)
MITLQLSDLLDTENPQQVLEEAKTIILMMFPRFSFDCLEKAFKDIVLLFHGEYPGYRGYSGEYYSLRRTFDVFLAMTRIMHGIYIGEKSINETQINLGLICALMHDICSLRYRTDGDDGASDPYAYVGRMRGIEFMDTYIAGSGFPQEEFRHYDKIIMGTNFAIKISDISFDSQSTKRLSKMLAAAALMSRMADRSYLEESLFPYQEYGQTEIMRPEASIELLKEIISFYQLSKRRLYTELGGIHRYARLHFKIFWNVDRNLYTEAVQKNIVYLTSLYEAHKKQYRIHRTKDEVVAHQQAEAKDTLIGRGRKRPGFREKTKGLKSMQEVRAYYRDLLSLAEVIQAKVQRNEPIDIVVVWDRLKPIIKNDLIKSLYHYLVFEGSKAAGIAEHSIDVTIISLMVGRGMGYTGKMLLLLALLAFLNDVGMYRIPQEIVEKKGALNQEELKHIRKHPEESAAILSQLGDRFLWLANLSLQIHERADGTGYPKGIKEEKIHEFASIVGLADTYSAMIRDKPYRDSIEKNKAVKTMLASIKGKLSTKIMKAFLNQISLFPAGSYVRLNDFSIGRVTNTNPEFPLKPFVTVLYDHSGARLKKMRTVNLSQQPHLHIIEGVDERNLT